MYQPSNPPHPLNSLDQGAYPALVQRGLVAGLTATQIANALQETTGATAKTILAELELLLKR